MRGCYVVVIELILLMNSLKVKVGWQTINYFSNDFSPILCPPYRKSLTIEKQSARIFRKLPSRVAFFSKRVYA